MDGHLEMGMHSHHLAGIDLWLGLLCVTTANTAISISELLVSTVFLGVATDCILFLSTHWVGILLKACEKVASDLG